MDLDRALELARAGRAQAEQDFIEELRIPSVSTLPEHRADVRRNAEWLKARMEKMGMRTELTDVLEGGHPVLLGEWMGLPGAPTLTIYGHYDVQPTIRLSRRSAPSFLARIWATGSPPAPNWRAIVITGIHLGG